MLRDKLNKLEISQSDYNVLSRNISKTAREMHRKEIEEAVDDWMVNGNRKGKDYYTETFKQNG